MKGRRKKKVKVKTIDQFDIIKSVRMTWTRKPVTLAFRDKSKYTRRKKHKEKINESNHD